MTALEVPALSILATLLSSFLLLPASCFSPSYQSSIIVSDTAEVTQRRPLSAIALIALAMWRQLNTNSLALVLSFHLGVI